MNLGILSSALYLTCLANYWVTRLQQESYGKSMEVRRNMLKPWSSASYNLNTSGWCHIKGNLSRKEHVFIHPE